MVNFLKKLKIKNLTFTLNKNFLLLKGAIALDPGISIETAASSLDLLGNIFNECKTKGKYIM